MRIAPFITQSAWRRELLFFLFLIAVTFLNAREDFTSDHGWVDGMFVFIFLYLHVQANRFFILPLLDKRKYISYLFASLLLVLVFTVSALISDYYFTNVGWYDDLGANSLGYLVRFYLFSFAMTIPLLVAIHSLFKQYDEQLKREQDKVLLREMEINLLKEHTNPHFIFNALNGLYGLSLEKPERLPDKILQLSDIIRYNVQWSTVKWISLKQELTYLRQYIDFESDRKSSYVQVSARLEPNVALFAKKIAPMLLIFFVENAFKHVGRASSGCFIQVDMQSDGDFILFSVENTFSKNASISYALQTGIQNVKRRLEILYPTNFFLDVQTKDEVYRVDLRLNINSGVGMN